ncbi:MAG: hypothetical protein ACTSYD_02145 [Candidatus Heimdallarchaeaceae archaeon]
MTKMIQKSITIREDQNKWVKNTCINLSRFVQRKLDEARREMQESGKISLEG